MAKIKDYIIHLTQYYETDQTGIIHNANYFKWMESAMIEFLKSIGINLKDLDNKKTHMVILSQSINYYKYLKFDEEVKITCKITKLSSARIEFSYEIYNINANCLCATGHTSHCFINDELKPIIFEKMFLKEYNKLKKIAK